MKRRRCVHMSPGEAADQDSFFAGADNVGQEVDLVTGQGCRVA
jgi:hypothetical protein